MNTATFEQAGWTSLTRSIATLSRGSRREVVAVGGGALLVGATAIALWLASGVRVSEIARFVPYEIGFVVLPGWLVLRATAWSGSRLAEIVFGWTLGYLLEVVAFFVTAASGVRGLFAVYPAIVGVPAAVLAWRRRNARAAAESARPRVAPAGIWLGAGLCVLLLLYAAAIFFTQMPLPRSVGSATYQEDTVFATSLAAEVLHHWPATLPMVAGQPLHYQLFPFMHMAAISQVTGIDLSVVVMRLYEVPLVLLLALQLILAGRKVGAVRFVGVSAAFLVLFFGELDPSRGGTPFLFDDFFFYWLFYSHTFLFGLVFFLAAAILVCDLIDAGRSARTARWATWALATAFLIGCTGSKPYALLDVIGGLVVFVAWQLWRRRTLNRAAVVVLGVSAAVQVAANVIAFKWSSGGEVIRPLRAIEQMPGVGDLAVYLHRAWTTGGTKPVVGVPYGTLGLLGVTIVGLGLLLLRRARLTTSQAWFLALFVAALPPFFLLAQPGLGQLFVVFFGLVPGTVLGSLGYRELLLRFDRRTLTVSGAVLLLAVATVALVHALAKSQPYVDLQLTVIWLLVLCTALLQPWRRARLATAVGAVIGLVVFATPIGALVRGGTNIPRVGGWLAVIAVLVAIGGATAYLRGQPRAALGVLGAAVGGVLGLAILNTPLDWFPNLVERAAAGEPLYNQQNRGLTAGLYQGLLWIRNHTSPSAVLVVNNHSLDPHGGNSKYFYYSAFAQRRVVLESWDYTPQTAARHVFSLDLAHSPFPHRLKLSDAVFETGDLSAMRTLSREYGARYLVVDKVHQAPSPALSARVQPLFSNSDIDVYDLRAALLANTHPSHVPCTSQQVAGVTAVFGRASTLTAAYVRAHVAQEAGFQGLTVQRRGCHVYAVALTGLSDLAQARELKREARRVGIPVAIECLSRQPTGGLAAVFGHRRTRAAAERLRRAAERVGFQGLRVVQDACNDWTVDLYGLRTATARRAFRNEAARAGFRVAFEPG